MGLAAFRIASGGLGLIEYFFKRAHVFFFLKNMIC